MASKPTPSQLLRSAVRAGLERAGYSALLNPSGPDTDGSLRPAIEAYLAFHALKSGTPLEDLVTHLSLPRCCNRPDVDYTIEGEPMINVPGRNGVRPPAAQTIERFLSGDLDPLAAPRGVTFWTHDRIRVRWKFSQIPVATDRNLRRQFKVWENMCGVRFAVVPEPGHVNITIYEKRLGMGILGMAQLPGRGMPENSTLWQQISLGHRWDVALLNTTGAHETGHNLGSGHRRGGLMNPSHIPGLTNPNADDLAWARAHYPPRGDENPADIDLVNWQDAPTPPPTPDPGTPPPVPPGGEGTVWVATYCAIQESKDGQTAVMSGTFRRA